MASGAMGVAVRELRDLFRNGSSVGLTDGQLLARYAASNDGPAFAALVARHGPMVLSACRAVLRHEHDVEDAFQATFLVLARKARSVRAGDALGGWLHRVAYRVAVQASIAAQAEAPARDGDAGDGDGDPGHGPPRARSRRRLPSCTRRSTGCRRACGCRWCSATWRA